MSRVQADNATNAFPNLFESLNCISTPADLGLALVELDTGVNSVCKTWKTVAANLLLSCSNTMQCQEGSHFLRSRLMSGTSMTSTEYS